eukprot:6193709-Pleurochrysis_carterae.AAC.6
MHAASTDKMWLCAKASAGGQRPRLEHAKRAAHVAARLDAEAPAPAVDGGAQRIARRRVHQNVVAHRAAHQGPLRRGAAPTALRPRAKTWLALRPFFRRRFAPKTWRVLLERMEWPACSAISWNL